jgi:hypothetical protein
MNSTDLHLQYKLETGKGFAYMQRSRTKRDHYASEPLPYYKETGYTCEYAEWLEELLLTLLNNNKL